MPGRMEFELGVGRVRAAEKARPDTSGGPMRLLLIGDFSAASTQARLPLHQRRTRAVDFESLDDVLRSLAPQLSHPEGAISFASLDDFHPDALYRRLPLFKALREARDQPPAADLLGQLLGGPAGAAPRPAAATGIEALLQSVVAPHIVPDDGGRAAAYRRAVDTAAAEQMRGLLHAPAFQALEAAWRGVQWLLENLESGEALELHLFDATQRELLADLVSAQGQLKNTGRYQGLAGRGGPAPDGLDGQAWSLLVGLYRFGPAPQDIGLLAGLGLLAQQLGAPLLAEADLALATADEAQLTGWQQLRQSEAAPWIGLAAPRPLLRRPYGARSETLESFAFEEFEAAPEHQEFLWAPAALAPALLIARGGDAREIGDLPAYHRRVDGELQLQPCAEFPLDEQAGQTLLNAGLMPLLSHRHHNAATLLRLQSIAAPATALAGLAQGRA